MSAEELARSVAGYFERVADEVFKGDPASNPALTVEVLGAGPAADTEVMIVITPWTTMGMAFPPDGRLPETLRIDHRNYPVMPNEIPGVGRYHAVLLIPDVSGFADQDALRHEALSLLPGLASSIEKARSELTGVDDPGRRALLTNLGHTDDTFSRVSAFGDPDDASALRQG